MGTGSSGLDKKQRGGAQVGSLADQVLEAADKGVTLPQKTYQRYYESVPVSEQVDALRNVPISAANTIINKMPFVEEDNGYLSLSVGDAFGGYIMDETGSVNVAMRAGVIPGEKLYSVTTFSDFGDGVTVGDTEYYTSLRAAKNAVRDHIKEAAFSSR